VPSGMASSRGRTSTICSGLSNAVVSDGLLGISSDFSGSRSYFENNFFNSLSFNRMGIPPLK